MAEVINLRLARKARSRDQAAKAAAANRAKHGQSKAEKATTQVETARITRLLDGAKLDD
jgi:hypothetical protein